MAKSIEAWAVMKKGKFVFMQGTFDLYPYLAVFKDELGALVADEMVNTHRREPKAVRVRITVDNA